MPATVHRLPVSEQVERAGQVALFEMSTGDVDMYVDDVPAQFLLCREKGHDFETLAESRGRLTFVDVDDEGLLVRKVRCRCCVSVTRVEKWDEVGRGKNRRITQIGTSHLEYHADPYGNRYQAKPGLGRMTRRQVRESLATKSAGTKTAAQYRREVAAAKKAV